MLHGVYVTSGSRVDHGLRCDAAGLLLPGEAALTGHSAAWWYGVRYAPPDASVLVAMPERVRRDGVRGIRIHRTPLAEGDVMIAGGKRLATPVRAAWDSATLIRGDEAVVLIDGMLQAGLLMTADLLARAQARRGAWGVAHFRAAVDLADPNAESPQETRTRLLIGRSGLPMPISQYEVRAGDRFIARVDFAWPEHRVVLEYQGGHHADQLQMRRDDRRRNELTAAGWTVVFATAADLWDPQRFLAVLRSTLFGAAA